MNKDIKKQMDDFLYYNKNVEEAQEYYKTIIEEDFKEKWGEVAALLYQFSTTEKRLMCVDYNPKEKTYLIRSNATEFFAKFFELIQEELYGHEDVEDTVANSYTETETEKKVKETKEGCFVKTDFCDYEYKEAIGVITEFIDENHLTRFESIKGGPSIKISKLAGYKNKNEDGSFDFSFFVNVFDNEVCKGLNQKVIKSKLRSSGIIKSDPEGRYTKTTYLGKGKSRKMICITYKPKTI